MMVGWKTLMVDKTFLMRLGRVSNFREGWSNIFYLEPALRETRRVVPAAFTIVSTHHSALLDL
jgi:hypothetical protein